MKHLKIQHLSNNPKKYSSCHEYPKKYRFSKFKTLKNTPLIAVCKYAKSTLGKECLVINDLSKRICKGIFHLQAWNGDQSGNLRNFVYVMTMKLCISRH